MNYPLNFREKEGIVRVLYIIPLVIVLTASVVHAGEMTQAEEAGELPVYEALRVAGNIRIDGKLDEADWSAANGVTLQFPWESQTGTKQDTVVKILWDDANLYVGYDCQDAEIAAVYDTRDDPTYKDDCVEIFISPNRQKLDLYYGLEMNCRAVLYDYFYVFKRSLIKRFDMLGVKLATDLRGTLNAAGDKDEGWSLEVAIPFENFIDLNRDMPPKPGSSWQINLNRWDGVEPHRRLSIWSPSELERPNPHNPERFGILVFSDRKVRSRT
jgi:hypothetical protein